VRVRVAVRVRNVLNWAHEAIGVIVCRIMCQANLRKRHACFARRKETSFCFVVVDFFVVLFGSQHRQNLKTQAKFQRLEDSSIDFLFQQEMSSRNSVPIGMDLFGNYEGPTATKRRRDIGSRPTRWGPTRLMSCPAGQYQNIDDNCSCGQSGMLAVKQASYWGEHERIFAPKDHVLTPGRLSTYPGPDLQTTQQCDAPQQAKFAFCELDPTSLWM
jgi:hypothetical protein